MSNQTRNLISHRLIITAAATAMLGLGAVASGVHAAPGITQTDAEPLILAETQGMERRQDRREDRRDCRQEEGLVGKDKRDCKQEDRQERHEGDNGDKDDNNDKG